MRLQFRMLELFDTMLYSADFPKASRAVDLPASRWAAAGRRKPTSRTSTSCATDVLRCILADFGYVDSPVVAARRERATLMRTASAISRPR